MKRLRRTVYRYDFEPECPMDEIEATLVLAIKATECLHGEERARLEIAHYLSRERMKCVIDASTQVGRHLNLLFSGFVRREFGPDAFSVTNDVLLNRVAKAA